MKIAIIIYNIMSAIMLIACMFFTVLGILVQYNWIYIILPTISIVIFIFSLVKLKRYIDGYKKLMLSMYTSHLLVIFTVIQMLLTFKIEIITSIIITIITILMMTTMVFALGYIIRKLGANNATN